MNAEERAKHLQMMQTPDDWPVWPYLPMKRKAPGWTVGFLCETANVVEPRVYLGNMYSRKSLEDMEQKVYEDFEAILDDLWVVD
jgi:hypothetical protein